MEIGLLQLLNTRCDVADEHHIVRMTDFFLYRKHLCLVFEQVSTAASRCRHQHTRGSLPWHQHAHSALPL